MGRWVKGRQLHNWASSLIVKRCALIASAALRILRSFNPLQSPPLSLRRILQFPPRHHPPSAETANCDMMMMVELLCNCSGIPSEAKETCCIRNEFLSATLISAFQEPNSPRYHRNAGHCQTAEPQRRESFPQLRRSAWKRRNIEIWLDFRNKSNLKDLRLNFGNIQRLLKLN